MSEDSLKSIIFEKQEALLCAQHALNMLLQQHLFTAVDLAEIAKKLDSEENAVLDTGHRESQNMNDAGFFSVQVISEALKAFNLDLVSILHPGVAEIKADPLRARAFICNRSEHWFVIRKFGDQWFELNSCKAGPVLHTNMYVSLFLTQLTQDGYCIYVIEGKLPHCVAEEVISAHPITFVPPKRAKKEEEEKKEDKNEVKAFSGTGARLGDTTVPTPPVVEIDDDDELKEAIRRSLAEQAGPSHSGGYDDDLRRAIAMSTEDDSEERSFQMALAMSMEGGGGSTTPSAAATTAPTSAADEQRARREAFLKRFD